MFKPSLQKLIKDIYYAKHVPAFIQIPELGAIPEYITKPIHMSGTAHFCPGRFEGGGMRYLRFECWLNETRDVSGEINAVYFEEFRRHLGVDSAHATAAFWHHSPHGVNNTASLTKGFQLAQSRSSLLAKALLARRLLSPQSKPLAIILKMTMKPMRWFSCILPASR